MSDFIPGAPQVNDPRVLNDLLRALDVRGLLGELNVSDQVVPVVLLRTVADQENTVAVRNSIGEAQYFRSSAAAAVTTIVSPAQNTDGVVVYGGYAQHGGAASCSLMAKASTPTSSVDAAAWHLIHAQGWQNSSGPSIAGGVAWPLLVTAGLGLYDGSNDATAVSTISCMYSVI